MSACVRSVVNACFHKTVAVCARVCDKHSRHDDTRGWLTTQTVRTTVHEYTANLSANTLQARATSGRHQRCCCRQCWSKIRCRRCAARKLALRGRPAQERNVEHRAWQDDPASLCARRRLVGCPKNRQEKLIGSRRTARQRHESSSAVVHVVTQKTPVISRTVLTRFPFSRLI